MKTSQLISKARTAVTIALMLTGFTSLYAQTFMPSVALENIYPPGAPNSQVPTCYSYQGVIIAGAGVDTYISAINGQVMWHYTPPGAPLTILNQGVIPYPGDIDINVGFTYDGGGNPTAVVAYYRPGVGHFYDVYQWTAAGPVLPVSTQISTELNYRRISMDSHKGYGIVITWEESTGIYALTGLFGVYTLPVFLTGTASHEKPDVAFSHANVGLNLHFVYDTPNVLPGYDIIESEIDFFVLNSTVGSITTAIMDVNPVTALWSKVTASIDAPDHYFVDNWAYTYALDGQDIYVRVMDFNTSLSPITTNIVNGVTFGNFPIWSKEFRPRIAYNQSCTSFHVTWFSSFRTPPYGNCYLTEEIDESGLTLTSSPDYLLVANNSFFPVGATLNSIAFSKQNDNSPFLYTVFLDAAGVHHSYHNWPSTTNFRMAANPMAALRDKCTGHTHGSSALAGKLTGQVAIGPNPFSGSFKLMIPESLKDEAMSISVTNLQGQVMLQQEGAGASSAATIERLSKQLAPGIYLVNVKAPNTGVEQTFKINKIAGDN